MTKRIEKESKEHFDKIAADFVKKDLVPYCRILRRLRLYQSLKHIPLPIASLLEVGCGAGFSATYLRGHYYAYTGLDYAGKMIEYGKRYNSNEHTTFYCKNIKELGADEKFDVILMIGVIHHLVDVEEILRFLQKHLKPGGVLVANEPHRGNPLIWLMRLIRTRTDPNYPAEQVFYLESELRNLFVKCGYDTKLYPQGVLSTPLAETRFLPTFIGIPLAHILKILDPILDTLFSLPLLRRLSWNIVVQGRIPGKETVHG